MKVQINRKAAERDGEMLLSLMEFFQLVACVLVSWLLAYSCEFN